MLLQRAQAHLRRPLTHTLVHIARPRVPSPEDRVRSGKVTAPAAVRSTHQREATYRGLWPSRVQATATQGTESSPIPRAGRAGNEKRVDPANPLTTRGRRPEKAGEPSLPTPRGRNTADGTRQLAGRLYRPRTR